MPSSSLEQLSAAISDSRIRVEVTKLIGLGTEAVDDLSLLDEKIYLHQGAGAADPSDSWTAASSLLGLADDILGGVRALEAHLQMLASVSENSGATEADILDTDGDFDFDFDFDVATDTTGAKTQASGDEAAAGAGRADAEGNLIQGFEESFDEDFDDVFGSFSGAEESPGGKTIDESGIEALDFDGFDGAFDMLGASEPEKTSEERWSLLRAELESFAYALGSQLGDFDERFKQALSVQRFDHALRELNDVGSSVTDGVFALMIEIYEAFLDQVNRDGVLPGHKSTLSRALLVRRGLAVLRNAVHQANDIVQSEVGTPEPQEVAFGCIVSELDRFVGGEVFRAMRPADRVEIKNFLNEILGKTWEAARFDCEGLDKYLDSLAVVSERDVLIAHDSAQAREIRQILEAVTPLLDISPHGALGMIEQAFGIADSLYGVRESLDQLLAKWEKLGPETRAIPMDAVAMSLSLSEAIAGI